MERRCSRCGRVAAGRLEWRCPCGGAHEYAWTPHFDPGRIDLTTWSMWRYRAMLLPSGADPADPVTLGEGMSPIARIRWGNRPLLVKLDYLMPTGSYKDRGSSTLLTLLRAEGHSALVEDSSGNAGASIAAYAAAAGIEATIFVPAYTAAAKQAQIAAFGATLAPVEGPRAATSAACHKAARGTLYASHAWHPAFLLGQSSAAWELWEQQGGRLPDVIVLPLGQGGMLLGYARGARALHEAGLIERLPRLIGVQAAACAPVARAWRAGDSEVTPVTEGETIAAGVRIAAPARGAAILEAIRESEGALLTATDEQIRGAHRSLARRGLFVERTSALPFAAIDEVLGLVDPRDTILVPLSGSGLKEEA